MRAKFSPARDADVAERVERAFWPNCCKRPQLCENSAWINDKTLLLVINSAWNWRRGLKICSSLHENLFCSRAALTVVVNKCLSSDILSERTEKKFPRVGFRRKFVFAAWGYSPTWQECLRWSIHRQYNPDFTIKAKCSTQPTKIKYQLIIQVSQF